jgi:hypothetical protein
VLATELAGIGGPDLPLEVSAIDSFGARHRRAERSLTIVARIEVSLARVFLGQEQLCDVLDRCLDGEPLPARPCAPSGVAQLAEQLTVNQWVVGSSPTPGASAATSKVCTMVWGWPCTSLLSCPLRSGVAQLAEQLTVNQ